ncbi:MAG: class F sortase [bacterium]|nr:class F sortase [bacterium]
MKSKISLKWVASVVVIILSATAGFYYVKSSLPVGQSVLTVVKQIPQKIIYNKPIVAGAGSPIYLNIPKINVDALIEYVGVTPQGNMDAPKGPINVAWYKFGPRPGDEGSAVIAGHYGPWKRGKTSVFDDLNKLSKGDKIYVIDDKSATSTFIVREIRNFDSRADARLIFNSNDGGAHLNLITCQGEWISSEKSYSNRLVVFADKE